jgi:uncharacterized protein (UPF0147 family)
VTVADALAVPPEPVQARVKVLEFVSAPLEWLPEVAWGPDHAPEAVHEVAFVDDHVRVEEPPLATERGLAESDTVGTGGGGGMLDTETFVDVVAVPPAPVHARVNVLEVVSVLVDSLPDVPLAPDQAPVATQELAFVDDHVRVEELPLTTEVGLAESDTVGAGGAVTVTAAEAVAVPPAPVHARVNVLEALSAPLDWLPDVAWGPDHAPEAVHEVAFVDDHVRVEELPLTTAVGLAESDTVGAGGAVTVTAAEAVAVPPAPVHARANVLEVLSAPLDWLPEVAWGPDHAPEAVHELAFVDDHVRVEDPPVATAVGFAESDTVGTGGGGGMPDTDTVADVVAVPPAPVHARVNVLEVFSAPLDWLPDVAWGPDHAPEAVHEVAFVDDHVRVEEPPLATERGLAESDTVGTGGGGGMPDTDTVADVVAVPPAPVHARVNVLEVLSAPLDWLPDVAWGPDHAPEAVHKVAFVDDQVRVEELPLTMEVGLAESDTAGTGGGGGVPDTVTVADALAVPPGPVQTRENVLEFVSAPLDSLPEVALLPDHVPEARQEAASVEDQVSVEDSPLATETGFAARETVGATGGAPGEPVIGPTPASPQATSTRTSGETSSNDLIVAQALTPSRGVGSGVVCESVIAVGARAAGRSVIQIESHPGVAGGVDVAAVGRDIGLHLLHAVDVGRNQVADDLGAHDVAVSDAELRALGAGIGEVVEAPDGAVPPHNSHVRQRGLRHLKVDLVSRVDVRGNRAAQSQLDLLRARVILIDRMDSGGCHLIRSPATREERGRVGEVRPHLMTDSQPGRGRDVGPVQTDGFAVDPAAAFGDRVLHQGEAANVAVGRRSACPPSTTCRQEAEDERHQYEAKIHCFHSYPHQLRTW